MARLADLACGGDSGLACVPQGVVRADRLAARAAQRLGELRVRFGHTRYERSVQLFLRGLGQEVDGVLGS